MSTALPRRVLAEAIPPAKATVGNGPLALRRATRAYRRHNRRALKRLDMRERAKQVRFDRWLRSQPDGLPF